MKDWRLDRIASAARGENPMVLARMRSGFAVIGDTQFLPGYCVLLPYPRVDDLNSLTVTQRADFLVDMSLVGDAIQKVCQPARVNYDILGNTDAFLHAHVFPRYAWEIDSRRRYPVWLYPKTHWTDVEYQYQDEKHGQMKAKLTLALERLMAVNY
jgi:diadenosine tetraphosphate (Ap4A) HIT family hydrolase